jgi:hypothetical protein
MDNERTRTGGRLPRVARSSPESYFARVNADRALLPV